MSTVSQIVPEVDIDPSGVFKYILIRLNASTVDGGEKVESHLVRGYADCAYHSDIDDKVTSALQKLKESGALKHWSSKVLGGGRINHDPDNKSLKVYGYSQGFGKADHRVAVDLLKKVYQDYEITWSDEGY